MKSTERFKPRTFSLYAAFAFATFWLASLTSINGTSKPLAAVWESNPFSNFVDCVTPTLVVYDTGLVIARHSWGEEFPTFHSTSLSNEEFSSLSLAITNYFGGHEYQEQYDLTRASDHNTCKIFVFGSNQVSTTSIYGGGLYSISFGSTPSDVTIEPEFDNLPPLLAALVLRLKETSEEATSRWAPQKVRLDQRTHIFVPVLPADGLLSITRKAHAIREQDDFAPTISNRHPNMIQSRTEVNALMQESQSDLRLLGDTILKPNKSL